MTATKGGAVICISVQSVSVVIALKAGGGVAVRIFDQEQEASLSIDPDVCTVPRGACVAAERVSRGGTHNDERGTLPLQSVAQLQRVQKRARTWSSQRWWNEAALRPSLLHVYSRR